MNKDLADHMKTMKESNVKEMNDIRQSMSDDLKVNHNYIKSNLDTTVIDIGKKVNRRIDDEFNKDNIRNLVISKAEERIDKVADPLIEKQVEKKINPKIKITEEKIIDIDQTIKETNNKINELKSQNDFALVFSNAQTNDRKAFEQLLTWRNDKSSPYHDKAEQAAEKVMRDHQSIFKTEPIDLQWKNNFDPSKLNIQELQIVYNLSNTDPEYSRTKPSFIKYVWNRQDITTKDKMQFLVDIMKKENNLDVLAYAGQCFKEVSKQKEYNIATDDFLGWWNEHKDEIK
jgi:hypothetical protein